MLDDHQASSSTTSITTTTNGALNGRVKLPQLSEATPPGRITFRLLCGVSLSGAIIGKSAQIVKYLEQETGSNIRIEKSVPHCTERIINVIAPEFPKKTIVLKSSNKLEKQEKGEETEEEEDGKEEEVSPAQHGLIRVLERVLEVEAEAEGHYPTPGLGKGLVTCRLLADSSRIGYLMGKGGKRIKQIEVDSGAKIRVSVERCPACASPTDELIQIIGNSLAVKKAAVAVSQCLQDVNNIEKAQNIFGSKPLPTASTRAFSDPNAEFLRQNSTFLPPRLNSSGDYASRSYPMPAKEEIVFRLICSNDRIGGVIGKGGAIIKALQVETGASICVGAPLAESNDRVIHVSAMENAESRYSSAQNAVIRVFTRIVEVGNVNKLESGANKDSSVKALLLLPLEQIGCLLGKGGTIISEIRKASRTSIWILQGDGEVPPCAADNDAVIQIIGGLQNVQNALFNVTGRLRDNFFPDKIVNTAGRIREPTYSGLYPSMELSHKLGRQDTLTESMHGLGLSHPKMMSGDYLRGAMDTGREAAALRGGLEHGSGSRSAVVKNTTLEILVPEHVLGSVYGEQESNLSRLRQVSGAQVAVHEPYPGTSEATVIISGTPDQAQAAQSILHALILGSEGS